LLHYCAKEFASSVAINNIFLPRAPCVQFPFQFAN
jgi:hypothetical protein